MRVLLEAGAEVNAANRRRSTPLHWAIADEAKVRLLLGRGANVNARVVEGRTPLFLAAQLGNPYGVMRALLEQGADPNIASAAGQTPLMIAATRGDLEAIKLLLDAKATINAKNGAGETALMAAATDGNPLVVRLMLERGADAKVLSKRNESALGNAATSGNEESVRLLLDRGADVNSRNMRGYSPLMLAASSDTMPAGVVKLLLARGADSSFKGDYDETARDMAAKRGDTEVTRLLGGMKPLPAAMAAHQTATRRSIPDAVERAMAMVEKQSFNFIRIGGCNSCHSQDLTSAVNGFAKTRGLRVPREIPQLPDSMLAPPDRIVDLNVVNVAGVAWELFDVGMNGMPRNDFTDATVRLIKVSQLPQGSWAANEGRRPPMNAGEIQGAALAIYALKHYTPPGDEASSAEAIQRAVTWLDRATPRTTQDRAFQLLGLAWANGNADSIKRGARALVATQRPDGGWSQLTTTESDAYATGQALFALNTAARMAASDHGLSERDRFPAAHTGRRRDVARKVAIDLAAAVLREWLPVRAGSVHLHGGHRVGRDGTRRRGAADDDNGISAQALTRVARLVTHRADRFPRPAFSFNASLASRDAQSSCRSSWPRCSRTVHVASHRCRHPSQTSRCWSGGSRAP